MKNPIIKKIHLRSSCWSLIRTSLLLWAWLLPVPISAEGNCSAIKIVGLISQSEFKKLRVNYERNPLGKIRMTISGLTVYKKADASTESKVEIEIGLPFVQQSNSKKVVPTGGLTGFFSTEYETIEELKISVVQTLLNELPEFQLESIAIKPLSEFILISGELNDSRYFVYFSDVGVKLVDLFALVEPSPFASMIVFAELDHVGKNETIKERFPSYRSRWHGGNLDLSEIPIATVEPGSYLLLP